MPGTKRLARRPCRADGDAEQDREHQRFEISLPNEMSFDGLQHDRDHRDRDAEQNTRRQSAQMLDQITAPYKT